MRKKILEILLGSLKAKIVTSIVAILLVGGAVTAGVIYKNSLDQSNKKEVSLESNSEDTSKKAEENVDEKEDETLDNSGKATEEKALTNESEDQKVTSSNEGGNNGGSAELSKDSSSSQGVTTNPSNNTNSNNGSTVAPSSGNNPNSGNTSTPPKQTNPEPPKQEPVRASGIDEELTKKINEQGETISNYERSATEPRTAELIQSAKNLISGGQVLESIKTSWLYNSKYNLPAIYKGHSINTIVGETTYYYTRSPEWKNGIGGFTYVIAYWDSSINNYKLYYVRITLS